MAQQQTLAAGEGIAAGAQGALGSLKIALDIPLSTELFSVSALVLHLTHLQVEAGKIPVFSVCENPMCSITHVASRKVTLGLADWLP